VTRVFSDKISTRATRRPELEAAVKLAGEIRSSDVAVTLAVHDHKRLGRGIELAMLAEELKGSHDPSDIVFTVLAAMAVFSSLPIRQGCDLGGQVKDTVFDLAA
jgi:hypothetical protein